MACNYLDPVGAGGHRSEHPTEREMATGFNHRVPPRRRHSRVLRADLGSSARGLCSWPHYISPPSRCGRSLSESRDDLRLGLWPDLGAEPLATLRPCWTDTHPVPVGNVDDWLEGG